MGIGPKVAAVLFPFIAIAIFFSVKFRISFTFSHDTNKILFYTGLVLLIAGVIMYLLTLPSLLDGLKNTKLITTGTFFSAGILSILQ